MIFPRNFWPWLHCSARALLSMNSDALLRRPLSIRRPLLLLHLTRPLAGVRGCLWGYGNGNLGGVSGLAGRCPVHGGKQISNGQTEARVRVTRHDNANSSCLGSCGPRWSDGFGPCTDWTGVPERSGTAQEPLVNVPCTYQITGKPGCYTWDWCGMIARTTGSSACLAAVKLQVKPVLADDAAV
jgi:hypothetical protein